RLVTARAAFVGTEPTTRSPATRRVGDRRARLAGQPAFAPVENLLGEPVLLTPGDRPMNALASSQRNELEKFRGKEHPNGQLRPLVSRRHCLQKVTGGMYMAGWTRGSLFAARKAAGVASILGWVLVLSAAPALADPVTDPPPGDPGVAAPPAEPPPPPPLPFPAPA